jgi:hypothetical protein
MIVRVQVGIFAEVGPLNSFVSSRLAYPDTPNPKPLQLLHPVLKFDPSSNPPSFTSRTR